MEWQLLANHTAFTIPKGDLTLNDLDLKLINRFRAPQRKCVPRQGRLGPLPPLPDRQPASGVPGGQLREECERGVRGWICLREVF